MLPGDRLARGTAAARGGGIADTDISSASPMTKEEPHRRQKSERAEVQRSSGQAVCSSSSNSAA